MTSWWSTEKIKATVTQNFIEKELGSRKHQDSLHRVVAFGDGLTDDTYLDWILERSPRFFLTLNDIGVPDKIFAIIDRSFDDDDLPLSQDALWELNLFGTTSETLDKKFFRYQFNFLVQPLEPGGHVDYSTWEVVPLEPVVKRPGIGTPNSCTDKVLAQEQIYTRKKIPASGDNGIDRIRFIMHLKHLASIHHRHLSKVWATYSQDDFNYVLLTPCTEVTLKHLFEEQPKHFKSLEKQDRRQTLMTWTQCLTSALAYLHSRGFFHEALRPSSITIDHNNVLYLNDYNAIKALDVEESSNPYSGELYDHAPPENWQRQPRLHETAPLKTYLPGGGRTSRRLPKATITGPDLRPPLSPNTNSSISRTDSKSHSSSSSSSLPRPRNAVITTFTPPDAGFSLPSKHFPADVFSLTTVLLTLLSFLLGHSPKSFASYRSKLNRQAGRGNAPPDASFHKNLKQVDKWIDMLAKEAGQKEKKDLKFWGAVSEMANVCKLGVAKDPAARISAAELEKKFAGWVEWGLDRWRKCDCTAETRQEAEQQKLNPVLTQRESVLSWSKISERISESMDSDYVVPSPVTLRPRRNLSQRKSRDRASHLHRSRSSRPVSGISSRISSAFADRDGTSHRGSDVLSTLSSHARHFSFGSVKERGPSLQQQREQRSTPITENIYENAPSIMGHDVPDSEDGADSRASWEGVSEVWGLGNALEEDEQEEGTITPDDSDEGGFLNMKREKRMRGAPINLERSVKFSGMGTGTGRGRGKEKEMESVDWPLPLGTLTFDRGTA